MSEILYIKLMSGEEIIANTGVSSGGLVELNQPLQIHSMNTDHGASIQMSKWIPFCDAFSFSIGSKCVMLMSSPSEDMLKYYHECLEVLKNIETEGATVH